MQDFSIHGHAFAGAYAEPVADLELIDRHIGFVPVGVEAVGNLGSEIEESTDGLVGAGVGALFDDLAEEDNGGDEGRAFEVEGDAVMGVHQARREVVTEEHGGDRIKVGRAGAGHGEREHVGVALDDGLPPPADKERAATKKDGGGEDELQPTRYEGEGQETAEAGNHGAHGEDEDRDGQGDGGPESRSKHALMGQPHVDGGIGFFAPGSGSVVVVWHDGRRRKGVMRPLPRTRRRLRARLSEVAAGG